MNQSKPINTSVLIGNNHRSPQGHSHKLLIKRYTSVFLTILLLLAGSANAVSAQEENWDASAACKDGGWQSQRDSDGNLFKNQGKCVSYAVQGGEVIAISLSIVGGTTDNDGYISGTGFTPGADITVSTFVTEFAPVDLFLSTNTTIDADGNFTSINHFYWCAHFEVSDVTDAVLTVVDSEGVSATLYVDLAAYCP